MNTALLQTNERSLIGLQPHSGNLFVGKIRHEFIQENAISTTFGIFRRFSLKYDGEVA